MKESDWNELPLEKDVYHWNVHIILYPVVMVIIMLFLYLFILGESRLHNGE